jgi:hypothetical protein
VTKSRAKQKKQNEKILSHQKKPLTHFQVKMCGTVRNAPLKAPPMMINM